jgi:YbbR domain-containing protein
MFGKILRAITNYPQLKVVALVIAVVVWFYANTQLQEEVTLRIPLTVQVPQDYRLVYQSHRSIQLRLRGPQYLIQRRQDEDENNSLHMSARLTEEEVEEGMSELEVVPEWLNAPSSDMVQVNVVNIRPQIVRVRASRNISRTLPVEVELSGAPHQGYQLRETVAVPTEVTVTGPAFVLEEMDVIQTEEVPLWDARQSFRRVVPLQLRPTVQVDANAEVPVRLQAQPSEVAVHVAIGGQRVERAIPNIPVHVLRPRTFPYEVEIPTEDSTVEVTLTGLPQELEEVSAEDVVAFVDLSRKTVGEIPPGERQPSKEDVRVRLDTEAEVKVKSITPELVTTVLKNPVD